MPEYVYALHDFHPEHEDEVSFHAGERIEVVEKDDLYSDGWWQGRNLAGKVGLFPQSYTAPVPSADSVATSSSTASGTTEPASTDPASKSVLQPLDEESDSELPMTKIHSPIPQTLATVVLNGREADVVSVATHQRSASGAEVMKATLTDVQQALEQLGRGQGRNIDGDEARSFSFTSSRGDNTEGETDTDFDISDVDGPEGGGGESWHKGARTKLAEKARRAVEEAEKLEAMMTGGGSSERRTVAPPIEVELSDESEGEEDYTTHSSIFPREHPHIPEEDEDVETDQDCTTPPTPQHVKEPSSERNTVKRASSGANSAHLVMPERDDTETQTATRTSFPVFEPPAALPSADTRNDQPLEQSERYPEPKRNSNNAVYRESLIALPSPTGSFLGMSGGMPLHKEQPMSKHSSVASASSMRPTASGMSQPPLTASSLQTTLVEEQPKKKGHPSEWSVEDVVEWLKTKGFDLDVCDKFTEQEITGDVLLELDVNLLKTEIGIMAFGKRMRIANAITDLRRPPSIIYSDHADQRSPSLAPHSPLSPSQSHSHSHQSSHQSHSRHQSLSHSHHSYPGSGAGVPLGHPYAQGSPSFNGPMMYTAAGMTYTGAAGVDSNGMEYLGLQDRSPMMLQEPEGLGMSVSAPAMNGKGSKGRPAHLMLSPSDGALKESAKTVSDVPEEDEEEEDRGVASDGEAVHTMSMRRRIFGRSHDSSASKASSANSRHSKDGSIMALSPLIPEKEKSKDKDKDKDKDSSSARHARSKKSLDGGKGGERLSIFGGTFPGTLGKSRKPPPKYPATGEEPSTDRSSMFSRLHSTSSRKTSASSQRPVTPNANGTPKHSFKDPKGKESKSPVIVAKETRDPALLRKRTSSAPAPPTDASRNGGGVANGTAGAVFGITTPIKQGQSILEQIGESDHNGWMRKKGDRYNSWKQRYFVLKGPHLYCLRSNSNAETKIKGYINIVGYKVTVDENVNPGRYGFRIEHDSDKTHYFSSEEKTVIRDWMKAIMKATIGRDYTKPVISSCNIPTIPLTVAQAMNPAPRPPSPTARDATQRALRRENTNQLSSRDARILMGLPSSNDSKEERTRLESFFSNEAVAPNGQGMNGSTNTTPKAPAPVRPSREMRRMSASRASVSNSAEDNALIEWANSHLPMSLQIRDSTGSVCGGLALLRIAESIKGRPTSPPVPDSAFPQNPTDDKLDGLFRLFDFLLDNDVKMGSVSINDVRQGKRDKILQLLKALKAWEEKRRAIAHSIGSATSVHAGSMMAPVAMAW